MDTLISQKLNIQLKFLNIYQYTSISSYSYHRQYLDSHQLHIHQLQKSQVEQYDFTDKLYIVHLLEQVAQQPNIQLKLLNIYRYTSTSSYQYHQKYLDNLQLHISCSSSRLRRMISWISFTLSVDTCIQSHIYKVSFFSRPIHPTTIWLICFECSRISKHTF